MLPRISLHRTYLFLILATGFLFIIVNVRQKEFCGHAQRGGDVGGSSGVVLDTVASYPMTTQQGVTTAKKTAEVDQDHNRVTVNVGEEEEEDEDEFHVDVAKEKVVLEPVALPVESLSTYAPMPDHERPWYMSGGQRFPSPAAYSRKSGKRVANLWPQEQPGSDRITNQLMFVPPSGSAGDHPSRNKKILAFNGLGWFGVKSGEDYFRHARCPVNTCTLTSDRADSADADAILYKDSFYSPGHAKPRKQVWILYFLESPYSTYDIKFNDVMNWTATYRRDSDIVAPYERWAYYDDRVKQKLHPERNYAANKTKKVAWFVSNCLAKNQRLQYAHELEKHISVDIYGACGTHKCPREKAKACFDMLDHDYKFYLAFENSNCKDYITEKFYVNGLGRNILPIVMGARPEDYERNAPYRSYLHVDDFGSAQDLAAYLHRLDQDDDLYNSYFRWKGTGEFINTYFFCRVCAMLHDDFPAKSYRDVNDWWRGPGTCINGTW